MKLRNKIHLYTAVLFIGLLIFINISIYFLFKNIMVATEVTNAEEELTNIIQGVSSAIDTAEPSILLQAYLPINGKIEIVTETGENGLMTYSPSEQSLKNHRTSFVPEEIKQQITVGDKNYYFQSIPIILSDGSVANLQVTKSIQNAFDQIRVLGIVLLAVTVIAMIPIIASSHLLSKIIMNPITSLTNTMKDISVSGVFKTIEIENSSKDELNEMGKTFNHMIDLLESNFTKQEQFVSNASHELKTPLTVIESYASLLKRRGLEKPEIFNESIEAIHSESIRMKEMTEQLLLLAKPHEQLNLEFEEFSPTEIIQSTIKSFKNAYHREVIFQEEEEFTVRSDEQRLKHLVYIILENAIKYSDDEIKVTVGKENNKGFISIIDRGIGIPKEDIDKVFDRFYRVDKARSRKYGGTGLGLSLANEIANAIHAEIKIDSAVGVGTNMTIYIPLKD